MRNSPIVHGETQFFSRWRDLPSSSFAGLPTLTLSLYTKNEKKMKKIPWMG